MTQPVIKEERAKQGREGKPVLTVLLVSLSVLAVAIVVYLFWVGANTPEVEEGVPVEVPLITPADPANPIPTAPPGGPGEQRQ